RSGPFRRTVAVPPLPRDGGEGLRAPDPARALHVLGRAGRTDDLRLFARGPGRNGRRRADRGGVRVLLDPLPFQSQPVLRLAAPSPPAPLPRGERGAQEPKPPQGYPSPLVG